MKNQVKHSNVMKDLINKIIDQLSEYLAYRKGLLPVLGVMFIFINWVIQLIPGTSWISSSNTFLHFGVILAIIGFMLAWAL